MKENLAFLLAFWIVWALTAALCYLLNLVFDYSLFTYSWQEYVIIGFAGAVAGTFGPILAAWIGKIFKRNHDV